MRKTSKYVITLILCLIVFVCAGLIFSGCRVALDDSSDTHKEVCNVIYSTDGNGTISGNTTQSVAYGENTTTVTAVPNEGYRFIKWSDTGNESPERLDENVTKDITAIAQFAHIVYSVNYSTAGNGIISGNTTQSIAYGENTITVIAVPDEGYKFVKWSDGITTSERQDKNITADKSVIAIFEKIKFAVTYTASEGGTIDGIAEQEVEYGEDSISITAVPNIGYKFVKWSDGNSSTIRREENVTSEICLTAEFEFLFYDGSGSILNPFTITNYSQLNNIWYYPESNYKLINDLDLSGINHEPIFDDITPFAGTFNGNNNTISNLTVNTESNFPSLFGFIGNGSVSYLNLINANIKANNFNTIVAHKNYCIGAIAGVSLGFIHNLTVSGKIDAVELYYDGIAIGGMVGMACGTIANCVTDMQIEISDIQRNNDTGITVPYSFGGLAGVCDSANIRSCTINGSMTVSRSSTAVIVGALTGYYFTSMLADAKVADCIIHADITGDSYYDAGGFIGRLDVANNSSLEICDSIVNGNIQNGYVGGFICNGFCYGTLTIENCHTDNLIKYLSYAAGFIYRYTGSSTANISIKDCSSCGDIIGGVDSSKEGQYLGNAAGFCFDIMQLNLINCSATNNIFAKRGYGFTFSSYKTHIERCYYIGMIYAEYGSGFSYGISSCTINNCFSNSTFVDSETGDKTYDFAGVIQNSDLINCYCVGNAPSNVIYRASNSNIINFHTLKPLTDEIEVIFKITNDLEFLIDITVYDNIEEMYFIAEKLNDGDEAWINVENNLPQLIYEPKVI